MIPDGVRGLPVADPVTMGLLISLARPVPLLVETGSVPAGVVNGPVPDPATGEEPLPVAWPVLPVPRLLV